MSSSSVLPLSSSLPSHSPWVGEGGAEGGLGVARFWGASALLFVLNTFLEYFGSFLYMLVAILMTSMPLRTGDRRSTGCLFFSSG